MWAGKEREAPGSCRRGLTLDTEWRNMLEHVAVWLHTDSHNADELGREKERERETAAASEAFLTNCDASELLLVKVLTHSHLSFTLSQC